jgi:ribosome-associated toxin RatA of RatAB toxin-antitoxin module
MSYAEPMHTPTPTTPTQRTLFAFIALLFALIAPHPAVAASATEPQGHRGILTPITSAPTGVVLTPQERNQLESGKHVERHVKSDGGGSGIAVQYIRATPEQIWATILSYHRYKSWVKNVVDCSIYRREGNVIFIDMQTSILGFRSQIFTKNTVQKAEGYMAWTLDYDRKSDVNDLVGYWRVQPVDNQPGVTRLEHSNSISMRGVPGFLVNYMTRDALAEGTAWVKREAEKRNQSAR